MQKVPPGGSNLGALLEFCLRHHNKHLYFPRAQTSIYSFNFFFNFKKSIVLCTLGPVWIGYSSGILVYSEQTKFFFFFWHLVSCFLDTVFLFSLHILLKLVFLQLPESCQVEDSILEIQYMKISSFPSILNSLLESRSLERK